MSLKDKLLSFSLTATLAFSGAGCLKTFPVRERLPQKPTIQSYNPVEKYALLVSALSDFNSKYSEKNVEDGDSLALFRMYETLIKNGFRDDHIFMLYGADGKTPNFNVGKSKIAKRVKNKQFSGQYDNTASESNIEDILDGFKKRVDENDKVVVYIAGHGNKFGSIGLETGARIYPYEVQDYVDDWKSDSNWFMLMNCYSGKTIEDIDVDNVCLFAASEPDKLNWIDSYWCSGVEFLKNKTRQSNDFNKDGVIDCEEAVSKLRLEAAIYYHELKTIIDDYYEKGIIDFNVDDINLQPVMKVGENFKKTNLK